MKTQSKLSLGDFLARNPFPNALTDGLFYREKMRAIHNIAPDQSPRLMLDIGGGRSGLCSLLYPATEVITLDIDWQSAAADTARSQGRFVCADGCRLPFANQVFDMVALFDVLEHVEDHQTMVSETLRVLRPAGSVLISTPNTTWEYPFYSFMQRYCPHESELMVRWGHVRRGYSIIDIERLFGYKVEKTATFINPLTAFFHDVAFSNLSRKKRLMLYTLALLPTYIGYICHHRRVSGTETAMHLKKR